MSYLSLSKRTSYCATANLSHVVSSSHSTFDNRDKFFPTTVSQNIVRGSAINRGTNKILKHLEKVHISLEMSWELILLFRGMLLWFETEKRGSTEMTGKMHQLFSYTVS